MSAGILALSFPALGYPTGHWYDAGPGAVVMSYDAQKAVSVQGTVDNGAMRISHLAIERGMKWRGLLHSTGCAYPVAEPHRKISKAG